jgi:hypothetical protein
VLLTALRNGDDALREDVLNCLRGLVRGEKGWLHKRGITHSHTQNKHICHRLKTYQHARTHTHTHTHQISSVRQHLRRFLPELLAAAHECWLGPSQRTCLSLLAELSITLRDDFK